MNVQAKLWAQQWSIMKGQDRQDLVLPYGQWVTAAVFKGLAPKDVFSVELVSMGHSVLELCESFDDEGEKVTAGQWLQKLNGLKGLATIGGQFSLWFDETFHAGVECFKSPHAVLKLKFMPKDVDRVLKVGWLVREGVR